VQGSDKFRAKYFTDICPYAYRMALLLAELHEEHHDKELWTDFHAHNLRVDRNGAAMVGGLSGVLSVYPPNSLCGVWLIQFADYDVGNRSIESGDRHDRVPEARRLMSAEHRSTDYVGSFGVERSAEYAVRQVYPPSTVRQAGPEFRCAD